MQKMVPQAFLGLALGLTLSATARAETSPADRMSRQAIDWFKAINVGGPAGTMVPGVSRSITGYLGKDNHIEVLVPDDCSRSGKAYYGHTWAGVFHAFELTPVQARQLGIKADRVTVRASGRSRDSRQAEPLVQLDRLRIGHGERLTDREAITGSVTCQFFKKPTGSLVLRFGYVLKDCTVAVTRPLRELPGDGVVSFRVDPINHDGKTPHTGPLPVFVDLCLENGAGFDRKLTVVSNTMALLLDVQANGAGAAAGKGSVQGTTWQFPGSKTTVEFLVGGRVRFNDTTAGGKWKQEGNRLTFDCNDFTLWEMTVDGDTMTGTWRRLRGQDVGQRVPSSLRRVAWR